MTAVVKMTGSFYGLPPWVALIALGLGGLLFGVWIGLWWGERP